jgi:hypothetical protein
MYSLLVLHIGQESQSLPWPEEYTVNVSYSLTNNCYRRHNYYDYIDPGGGTPISRNSHVDDNSFLLVSACLIYLTRCLRIETSTYTIVKG